MRVLLLERLDLGVLLLDTNFKVSAVLADPGVTSNLSLEAGLKGLELFILALQRGLEFGDFQLRLIELSLKCTAFRLHRFAL